MGDPKPYKVVRDVDLEDLEDLLNREAPDYKFVQAIRQGSYQDLTVVLEHIPIGLRI